MHDKAILENVTNSESIPDCCKNQEMCDNAVDNYPHELKSECSKAQKVITESCKTQIMCDQAVSIHPSTAKFVLEWYKTQEIGDKAVNKCFYVFDSVPDWYKCQEMCYSVDSENPFVLQYCPHK